MAKKKDKGAKAQDPISRVDQVRAAVEQAFEATAQGAGPVREHAQELADELAGAAARVRDMLDDLRGPTPDELTALREQVTALESRVATLEAAARKPAAPRRPATAKPATRKPAARKPAATKPAARKPAPDA